ncbi:UNKNOWN [Stylonychia lemnae]|uniref:Uncharacterized protein n=1 Tax=Stylonychia lemnae TaxID=5949 RepID=A0A078AA92_STYLE|nr:UNKNOWN [Stylonychia lemnae]|eukprot:CDW79114.1 UNKNOWN [Stylonychia lemnae]
MEYFNANFPITHCKNDIIEASLKNDASFLLNEVKTTQQVQEKTQKISQFDLQQKQIEECSKKSMTDVMNEQLQIYQSAQSSQNLDIKPLQSQNMSYQKHPISMLNLYKRIQNFWQFLRPLEKALQIEVTYHVQINILDLLNVQIKTAKNNIIDPI